MRRFIGVARRVLARTSDTTLGCRSGRGALERHLPVHTPSRVNPAREGNCACLRPMRILKRVRVLATMTSYASAKVDHGERRA